jgi:Right handed beta helix region
VICDLINSDQSGLKHIDNGIYRQSNRLCIGVCLIAMGSIVGACDETRVADDQPGVSIPADPLAVTEVLQGKRTTANAVWWGYDSRNGTRMIQAAINSPATKVIVPNVGLPWLVDPIILKSNQEIQIDSKVVIAARPGSFLGTGDALLNAEDDSNITVSGSSATIRMRKEDYVHPPYAPSQWRHCFSLLGCVNVKVSGIRFANSGGDGIYLGRGNNHSDCSGITITDVLCDSNYRQGMSVISAKNLIVENCVFSSTQGVPPQSGIDFEPNNPDEHLVNVLVNNCTATNNAFFGIIISFYNLGAGSDPLSITIEHCHVANNSSGSLYMYGPLDQQGNLGFVRLLNNSFVGKQIFERVDDISVQIE